MKGALFAPQLILIRNLTVSTRRAEKQREILLIGTGFLLTLQSSALFDWPLAEDLLPDENVSELTPPKTMV